MKKRPRPTPSAGASSTADVICKNVDVTCSSTFSAPLDLIVVGDGVLGLATALACRRRSEDLRIAVVGRERSSGGASRAAAAMLGALAEVDARTFEDERSRAKFELARRSVPRWSEWLGRLSEVAGRPVPAMTPGTVVTVTDPTVDGPALQAIQEAAGRFGVATESLEVRDVPGLRPRRTPPEAPALRIAGEGAIDPIQVLSVLEAAAMESNVLRIHEEAIGIDERTIEFASGTKLSADRILVANGAHASSLLATHPDLVGRVPRIRFGTGVGIRATIPLEADIPREVVRTPNRPGGEGVYFAPHGPGRFYVGATCDVADEPRDHPRIAALRRILDTAMDDLSTDLGRAECQPVLGHRPVSSDGAPLLGRGTESVWIATGTHRDGFVSAPEISDRLAEELVLGAAALPSVLGPCRSGMPEGTPAGSVPT